MLDSSWDALGVPSHKILPKVLRGVLDNVGTSADPSIDGAKPSIKMVALAGGHGKTALWEAVYLRLFAEGAGRG